MQDRLDRYLDARGMEPAGPLGHGKDGTVIQAVGPAGYSAVKVHRVGEVYRRERDCYFRLRDLDIDEVAGLEVPVLLDHDDDLLVLEMTIASPPFLLDFASAYLNDPPDWPEDVMAHWHGELQERFEDRYADVLAVLAELESSAGVHLFDVHADNLKFEPSSAPAR